MGYDDAYKSKEDDRWRGASKVQQVDISPLCCLQINPRKMQEGRRREGKKKRKLEVVKDKKRECRHSKKELGLVSTLFISPVGSGFREPSGWVCDRSPLTLDPPQPAPGVEVFPHNVFLVTLWF